MASYGYSSVPGSDGLKTAARGQDDEVAALEALDPSATAGRWVHGEWLCRVVVREGAVAVLSDVFDRLLPLHEAEEAAVYLQLYRLSFGEERNWCRTSRKLLRERCNLSDRRLGGALAGLVEKEHIRLLHRDRRGTLYRVLLPHEVFGEPDRDRVFSARPAAQRPQKLRQHAKAVGSTVKQAPARGGKAARAAKPAAAANTKPSSTESQNNTLLKSYSKEGSLAVPTPSAQPSARPRKRSKRLTVGEVASAFLERFPARATTNAEVVEAIFGRMEENIVLREVADELTRFGQRAPKHLKLADLARWLEQNGAGR